MSHQFLMTKIERAQQFAHAAHDSVKQVRKYSGEPYWVHTDEVAAIVTEICKPQNVTKNQTTSIYTYGEAEDMVCAAHLHDYLEDVNPNGAAIIAKEFGDHVMDMVIGLTDRYTKERYPKMSRKERKANEAKRFDIESPMVKTIKLADLISNTRSIVAYDPDFAKTYLREKMALLPYLADGSPVLLQRANDIALAGFASLGMTYNPSDYAISR